MSTEPGYGLSGHLNLTGARSHVPALIRSTGSNLCRQFYVQQFTAPHALRQLQRGLLRTNHKLLHP